MSISLYIHIPFCKRKCQYCDFTSFAGKDELIPRYLDALDSEALYISPAGEKLKVDTVFVGGGTPTLLDEEQLTRLCRTINERFDVRSGAEFTVEANPGTISKEKLSVLKKKWRQQDEPGSSGF